MDILSNFIIVVLLIFVEVLLDFLRQPNFLLTIKVSSTLPSHKLGKISQALDGLKDWVLSILRVDKKNLKHLCFFLLLLIIVILSEYFTRLFIKPQLSSSEIEGYHFIAV